MPRTDGIARRLQRALDVETVGMEGFSRRPGRAWLLNPRRLEIVLSAAAYPGLHLRSASRLLLQPLPTLRFHVRKLVEHGLLAARSIRGRTALFVPGMYPRTAEPLLAAWEDTVTRAIVRALRASRWASVHQIAAASGLPRPGVVRAIETLSSSGAVRSVGSRTERFALTSRWGAFERMCRDGVEARLQGFLAFLRREDLHPSAKRVRAGVYRITLDGPRSRIRLVLPLDPLNRDTR